MKEEKNGTQQNWNSRELNELRHRYTLSERLWTSAARDLFVDVDPRACFLALTDSNSTSCVHGVEGEKIKRKH